MVSIHIILSENQTHLREPLEQLGHEIIGEPREGLGFVYVEEGYELEDVLTIISAANQNPLQVYLAYPRRLTFFQKFMSLLFWFIHSKRLQDVQTGLRYYPEKVIEQLGVGTHPMDALIGVVRMKVEIEEIMTPSGRGSAEHSSWRDLIVLLRTFIKYLMSSFSSFIVDITIFQLFIFLLARYDDDLRIWVATIVARVISSVVNFLINKKLVFQNDEGIGVPAVKYFSLVITEMLSSGFLVSVIYSIIRIPETIIKLLVDLILFFSGYIIEKVYIFDKD